MLSVTERLVSNVLARILVLIGAYKFGSADKTLPPLRIFVCQKPCPPLGEPSVRSTTLRSVKRLVFVIDTAFSAT